MSRKFSNILVICSLVAVLVLLVSGTTLAAYHSIGNTVTAKVVYVDGETAENADKTDAKANVYYSDDNYGAEISVTKAHTQTTTLTPDYNSTAYTFVGWYVGDEATYNSLYAQKGLDALIADETIVTDVELEVSMEEDSNVLAIYQVNTYSSISYSYYTDPANSTGPTTFSATNVKYGTALSAGYATLDAFKATAASGYKFSGWKVQVTVDSTTTALSGTYEYATFDLSKFSGDEISVALSDPWGTVQTVTVTIVGVEGETGANSTIYPYASANYEYTLDALYNLIGIDRVAGYTYTLKIGDQEITDKVTFTENTTITFSKTAIQYSATISSDDATFATNDVAFTVESASDLFDASKWKATYSFWTINSVTSITYGGSAYTSSEALIAALAGADTKVALTANLNVTKWFTSISMTNSTTARAGKFDAAGSENYQSDASRYTSGVLTSGKEDYTPSIRVSTASLISDVVVSDSLYTTISEVEYNVSLYMFYITINGNSYNIVLNDVATSVDKDVENLTFNDLIVVLFVAMENTNSVPASATALSITSCKLCYVTTTAV